MKGQTPRLILALLILLVAAGHGIWLFADRGPLVSSDAYSYLSGALRLADSVSEGQPGTLCMADLSHGGRPPLYPILTIPFFTLFGRSSDAGIAVNGLFLILLMSATFALAKRQAGPGAGLLAALLVATFPPILHLLRTYRPAAALPACVALSLWLLVELLERRKPIWAWAFWASVAFGMLIHPAYLYVMVVPAIFGSMVLLITESPGWALLLRQPIAWLRQMANNRIMTHGLVPAPLFATVAVGGWYLTWGRELWSTLRRVSKAAQVAGTKNVTPTFDVTPNEWWYAATSPKAIGTVATILLLPAVLGLLLQRRRESDLVTPVLLLGTYVVLATQPTYAWMYAAPALPAVACLLARWTTSVRPRALMALVVIALVGTSLFQFGWCSWGPWQWPGSRVAQFLGAQIEVRSSCRSDRTLCPAPPKPNATGAGLEPLFARIHQDPTCRPGRTCRVFVVGFSFPNPDMLEFHTLLQRWPHAHVKFLGQGSSMGQTSYPIKRLLFNDYIVHRIVAPGDFPAHDYEQQTLRFLDQPPAAFAASHRRVARFETADGTLALIKRTQKPASQDEQDAVAHAFGVAPLEPVQ